MKRAYCWKETHQEKKAHHIKSKRDFFLKSITFTAVK